jgi:hypothetical protein
MKKIVSILCVGIIVLLILSIIPSNSIEDKASVENDKEYLTLVPVKPPASPPKK